MMRYRPDKRSPWIGLLCLALVLIVCGACRGGESGTSADSAPIIGVKIYEFDGDVPSLFDRWQKLGVNTVFVSEQLARRADFRAQANLAGTDLFLIFPVFLAIDEVVDDPGLYAVTGDGREAVDDWVKFACPSQEDFLQQRIQRVVELVRDVRPAALSLDFIRYFVFWEMVGSDHDPQALRDSCFCPRCLERFSEAIGRDIPTANPVEASVWVKQNASDEWVDFKCLTINETVARFIAAVREVQPDIAVNIHALPWREQDFERAVTRIAGQDYSALGALADYISPMCYSFMQRRAPTWVASVVNDLDRQAACSVLPSIQVGVAYRNGESFSAREFEAALRAALKPPSAGVVFWSWDAIAAEPEKETVIARVLSGKG